MLVRVAPHADDLPTVVKNFQVDGLIADWTVSRVLSEAIGRYRVPTIWVNNDQQGATDCVWPDDVASGRVATEHLISLGHKEIVFLRVPQMFHLSQPMRVAGYEEAMRQAGLSVRVIDCDCIDAPLDERRGAAYFVRRYSHPELWPALESPTMPTAVVAYNTLAALEFYTACHRRGLGVAGRFALVACDEILEHAEKAYPALSTVVIDHAEMGRRAVDMLMERIRTGGKPVPSAVVPVRLIQRESSTGPMPPT
jgi:LacI family transcriptional regulator